MRPELDLLGPALEAAVAEARRGELADEPIPAPRPIRPFLRFRRLPPPARAAVQAVLDADDEFRGRVAAGTDEATVGRAGWLLLTRPDGWRDEFDALVAARSADDDARGERSAQRRLQRALAALAQVEERAARQADELDDLRVRLAAAVSAAATAEGAAADARDERDRAEAERARAVRELKAMERRLAERTAELRAAEQRAGGAEAVGGAVAPASTAPDEAEAEARAAAASAASAALRDLTARLRDRWEAAGDLLDALDDELDAAAAAAGSAAPGSGVARNGTAARRRRPVRLGRGLVEGTVEAARWLVSRPGAVVLVDGYNVSMLGWPEFGGVEQRRALEQGLAELQRRTGAHVVVVFDGEGVEATRAVRTSVGSPVRVRFTAADVEADDEVLALVAASAAPVVVVVSNDRRVRDGARALGANVVGSDELLALLR